MADQHTAETTHTEYVVGFALDKRRRVALILKNRPAWQSGRLNGIGGHVEPGETADEAIVREFREETGTEVRGWEQLVLMDFPGALITFYRAWVEPEVLDGLRTTTDEEVFILQWNSPWEIELPGSMIPNLEWLLPLAFYTADRYEPLLVTAHVAEVVSPPESATDTPT